MTNRAIPPGETDSDPNTVTTGVPGLDDILGGGLINGGLYLIEGMAGAGKTILSTQVGFHRVAEGDMAHGGGSIRASAMTENIVLLRYVETTTSLYRIISIVKQREAAHDPSIRRFIIDEKGLHLMDGFVGTSTLLSARGTITPTLSAQDAGTRT